MGRKHQTPGTTLAVKARIADHIWSVEEIVTKKRCAAKRGRRHSMGNGCEHCSCSSATLH